MIKLVFVGFVIFSLVCSIQGLYSPQSNVIQLTKENFAQQVFDSSSIWMVEFYAPWCGHCKKLVPAWNSAATNLKGVVKVGAVNCDEHRELAGMFEIKGFPTILYFGSEQAPNPYQKGAPFKKHEPYNGQRTAAAIANYATSRLPNLVQSKNLDNFFSDSTLNKVVLFSDKTKTSNVYKGLALEFKDRLAFAQVTSSSDLVAQYGITKFPTFIVAETNGESHVFEGKPSADSLYSFVEPFAKKVDRRAPPKSSQSQQEPVGPAKLIDIDNAESFETNCLKRSGPSVFAVIDNSVEEADAYREILLEVAEKYKKQFRFLVVDGPSHPSFTQQLHIDAGYPQLFVLNPSKMAMASMIGSFDVSGISKFLEKVLLGSRRTVYKLDSLPVFE